MNCDFDYCVYNRDFSCLLKETKINSLGMCEECIIVSLPDSILQELKLYQLGEAIVGEGEERKWRKV